MADYVQLVGAQELQAKLAAMPGRAMSIIRGALHECAEELRTRDVQPVTPHLTGALRNSILNYGVEVAGSVATATVGAGGVASGKKVDYAAIVHEMPESNNWTEPNTGPKYLERPTKAYKLGERLAGRLRGRLERALAGH
jgi:hypothetical protein